MLNNNDRGPKAATQNDAKTTASYEDRGISVRVWSEDAPRTGRAIELLDLNAEKPEPHTLEMLVGKFDVRIHHTDEGIVVDVWDRECNADAPLATTYAFDSDADAAVRATPKATTHGEDDRGLSATQLDDKYNPDGDGEHPTYTREVWRADVCERNTLSGYWQWVEDQLQAVSA